MGENGSLMASAGDAQRGKVPAQPPVWIGFILGFVVMGAEIAASSGDLSEDSLLLILGLALIIVAFFLYCVYKLHKILKVMTNGDYPISPGESVGYHFLPIYNFIWIFKWPSAFSQYINQSKVTQMAPGWVLGLLLFFAGLVVDRLVPTLAVFMQFGVIGYMSFKLGEHAAGLTGSSSSLPDEDMQPPATQPVPASPLGISGQASPAVVDSPERKKTQASHFAEADKSSIGGDLPISEKKEDQPKNQASRSGAMNQEETPSPPSSRENEKAGHFRETQTFCTPPHFGLGRGAQFAGRYLVIEELGQGGMGKVYRVEDTKINEDVALKFLKPDISSNKLSIERFRNELKLARKISHKNVCRMYHFGESDGCLFMTMEYVPGEDLTCTLRRVGPLSPAKAVFIAGQIIDGLMEAHRLGVIHRDLKPKNIMIDREGSVRIMDFGIARILNVKGVTTAGTLVGTPEYMAPEQASGKRVDRRSDIYALGIILYEMVTGQVPFQGETALSTAWKHQHEEPRRPEALNDQIFPELSRIIMKCLEKRPEKRYQEASDLKADLEAIHSMLPQTDKIIPEKKSSLERIRTLLTSRKIRIPAAAAGILGAAAVIWLVFLSSESGSDQAPAGMLSSPAEMDPLAAGRTALGEGDYKLALVRFRQAAENKDTAYSARISLGDVFREQGNNDAAVEEYERAIALERHNPTAYLRLGSLFEGSAQNEIAAYYYRRFLNAAPEHPQRKEFENKISVADSKKPAEKEKSVPSGPSVNDLTERGIKAFEEGNYTTCIAWMDSVLKQNPGSSRALEYKRRAQEEWIQPQIEDLLNGYRSALEAGTLAGFYEKYCLPESLSRIKTEAELIARTYSGLQGFVSDVDIHLLEESRARAKFTHIITGTSRDSGVKSVLFEGEVTWELVRKKMGWKINEITSSSTR